MGLTQAQDLERMVALALDAPPDEYLPDGSYISGAARAGVLACPGSRYALTAGMCATWAAVGHQAWIALGGVGDDPYDEWEARSLVAFMGQVVNDDPEVADLIDQAWPQLSRVARQALGRTRREVRKLAEGQW